MSTLVEEAPVLTHSCKIEWFEHGQETFEKIAQYFAHARNVDYKNLLISEQQGLKYPDRKTRRHSLYALGLSKREADHVILANDDQWGLAERSAIFAINNWEKDIEKCTNQISKEYEKPTPNKSKVFSLNKEITRLESLIEKKIRKGHSVCFGGRLNQRNLTRYPDREDYQQTWEKKRLFTTFIGETGRSFGNPTIKVDPDTWVLSIVAPEPLGLGRKAIPLGRITPKAYSELLASRLLLNKTVYYEFVWCKKKQVWRLHYSIEHDDKEHGSRGDHERRVQGRTAGIDINAGHIDISIIDSHANVLHTHTIEYEYPSDIPNVVQKLVKHADHWGVESIGVENLKGLSRNRLSSYHNSKNLNKTIQKMYYNLILTQLKSLAFKYGFHLHVVSPKYTSKNTVQWSEPRFGTNKHLKAAYLIARRTIGLSITRNPEVLRQEHNSVSVLDTSTLLSNAQPNCNNNCLLDNSLRD